MSIDGNRIRSAAAERVGGRDEVRSKSVLAVDVLTTGLAASALRRHIVTALCVVVAIMAYAAGFRCRSVPDRVDLSDDVPPTRRNDGSTACCEAEEQLPNLILISDLADDDHPNTAAGVLEPGLEAGPVMISEPSSIRGF